MSRAATGFSHTLGHKLSLAIDCFQPCLAGELRSLVVADELLQSRQSD